MDTEQLASWKPLLLPGYVPLTDPVPLLNPRDSSLITIAVFCGNAPVGLIIAKQHPDFNVIEIHSLCVVEEHRTKNTALLMLEYLENIGKKSEETMLVAVYPNTPFFLQHWELPFIQAGWEGKQSVALECFFEDYSTFHPQWFERHYSLPEGFTLFLWKDLLPEEAEGIKRAVKAHRVPSSVDPFQGDASFEPSTSMGLRFQGCVVGWIITRLLQPDLLCYFSFFIEQSFEFKGVAIQLLIESVKRQQGASKPIHGALFRINLLTASSSWIHFVRRRLAPHASKVIEFTQAWKIVLTRENR